MFDRNKFLARVAQSDPNTNTQKLEEAIDIAIEYHGAQLRASGEPYYMHPLAVAEIIASMNLDYASVVTAILHDTIEDTSLTLKDIESRFGVDIAKLVDGVTKLTRIDFQPESVRQAENFRKLFIAISDDIRVLLVKLADRLHNMRTIKYIQTREKALKIALETLEIYVPLAERIGSNKIKYELEDRAFEVVHPDIYESIVLRLNNINDIGVGLVENIIDEIKKTLDRESIDSKVSGRQKAPYSIWMKMNEKNVSFEQLSDIIAFRVVVDSVADCYKTLGILHSNYQMVPNTFKDFISTPKENGYQSIHTVLIGPQKKRIEVQIRTNQMHEVCELGVAAHWQYKQKYHAADGMQYSWIRELMCILEQSADSEEFLKHTKLAMHDNQVFCFTPLGRIIPLPKGATPVDFAYAVHSDVGHHCIGSKINGKLLPLRTMLQNGDQVEILIDKNQTPSPSWEKFVTTGKARAEVRKFIRSQQRNEYINLGNRIVEKSLKAASIPHNIEILTAIFESLKRKNLDELYFGVGSGLIQREEVLKAAKNYTASKIKNIIRSKFEVFKTKVNRNHKFEPVPIKGFIPGMAVHYAGCCHPIPGDYISGVIHTGRGVTVHTKDCQMLLNFSSTPERVIDLLWDDEQVNINKYITRIQVTIANQIGSMSLLTNELTKYHANISNLKITERTQDFFEMYLDIEVPDTKHLQNLISVLNGYKQIYSVKRIKF